jgi:hypothetical protein
VTHRLLAWAESWPVFLAMCAWLLIWAGAHMVDAGRASGIERGGPSAAQAAEGSVTHLMD